MLGQHVDRGVGEPTSAFLINKQTVFIMLRKVPANNTELSVYTGIATCSRLTQRIYLTL